MKTTGNTILITGGGSGIGEGLANAFHKLGNTVIIGGRREDVLKSVCKKHDGMTYQVLDVSDPQSVEKAVANLKTKHPKLNCLINNAGIQRRIDFNQDNQSLFSLAEEIDVNLKGVVFVTAAILPLIKGNERATIINISSGLGFVPLAMTPIYSATKSAIHSFCLSLRHQLRASKVAVIEVAPPAVRTDLDRDGRHDKGPKPLEISNFVNQTMKALSSNRHEIAIGLARVLRVGSRLAPSRFFSLVNG